MRLQARTDKLLIHEVGDELVIYDRTSDRAHRLNATAARVWRSLDGARTVSDVATLIGTEEKVVQLTLGQLSAAKLLVGEEVSRRRAIGRVAGLAAAGLALPVVATITAPTARASVSPGCSAGQVFDPELGLCVDPPS